MAGFFSDLESTTLRNKKPIMPIKPKLLHILVHDKAFFYTYTECQGKSDFQNYLRHKPLGLITTIWILYRLSKGQVLQLEVKKRKDDKWEVYQMNNKLFEFTFRNSKKFMTTFEEHLTTWLEKQTFIRTKPPAGKTPE